MDPGDAPHGGSGEDPFQALLHAVVGHVVADEHTHHVDVMKNVHSKVPSSQTFVVPLFKNCAKIGPRQR